MYAYSLHPKNFSKIEEAFGDYTKESLKRLLYAVSARVFDGTEAPPLADPLDAGACECGMKPGALWVTTLISCDRPG